MSYRVILCYDLLYRFPLKALKFGLSPLSVSKPSSLNPEVRNILRYLLFHLRRYLKTGADPLFKMYIFSAFSEFRKATISFVMSVCLSVRPPAWKNLAATGRIFMNFDIGVFCENLLRKFKFH